MRLLLQDRHLALYLRRGPLLLPLNKYLQLALAFPYSLMEARFKMRISRMFRSSFGSCRTRNLSDVTETPTSIDQNHHKFDMLIDTLPPKARPLPSICKPKFHEKTTQTINNSIIPRQKVSCRYPPFISAKVNGRALRPVFPMFPLDPFYKELSFKEKKKRGSRSGKNKKSKKNNAAFSKSTTTNRRDVSLFSSTSQDSAYFEGSYWFSSEEEEREDESDTLFSTRSTLSNSDSSRSLRYHKRSQSKKQGGSRRRRANTKSSQVGVLLDGKVKDSFAVVKSSSDPYNDFRTSMVEMIVEKQMFSAKDLEQLLQCFLSLNSDRHHRIIVEVFTEIWETLFSSWY